MRTSFVGMTPAKKERERSVLLFQLPLTQLRCTQNPQQDEGRGTRIFIHWYFMSGDQKNVRTITEDTSKCSSRKEKKKNNRHELILKAPRYPSDSHRSSQDLHLLCEQQHPKSRRGRHLCGPVQPPCSDPELQHLG